MKAVYQQVSMLQVIKEHVHVYSAAVYYGGKVNRITGTFDDWKDFFLLDGVPARARVKAKSKL